MIFIRKNPEPPGLQNYKAEKRKTGGTPSWIEFSEMEEYAPAFEALRRALLEEQHFICCYCQQRITFKKADTGKLMMKTEHFEPKGGKKAVPQKQLDYGNLLAVCLGNSDSDQDKHCDSCKLDFPLSAIPNPSSGKRKDFKPVFKYDVRVQQREVVVLPIFGDNEPLKHDIEKVLNLNEQSLRSKRFSTWNSVWGLITKKDGSFDLRRMQQILEIYSDANQLEFKPFCDFIGSWLKQHLSEQST